jgi:hypothetical protein
MFENPTVNLNSFRNTRVVRVSSCGTAASKLRASDSSTVSTFVLQTSLFIQCHKQKFVRRSFWKFKQLCLGNLSELDTRSYQFCPHTMTYVYYNLPKY